MWLQRLKQVRAWWNSILAMHKVDIERIERYGEYVCDVINSNLRACEQVIWIKKTRIIQKAKSNLDLTFEEL